jgi:hypothetical protein
MITDLILAVLIISDIAFLILAIALCFVKSTQFLEFEYIFRFMCGILLIAMNYYISQLFLNGYTLAGGIAVFSPTMNTFFFWIMGGFSLLYVALQVAFYVVEKVEYATRKIATDVAGMEKKDFDMIKEENTNGQH